MEQSKSDSVEYLMTEPLFSPYSKWIAELCRVEKGMSVLDVGCGIGVSAFSMLEMVGQAGKITGLDISSGGISQAISRSSQLQIPNISFVISNAENLQFSNDVFDCITSSFAIIQIPDRLKALKEMIRVLKPGGSIGFTIPGLYHFQEFYNIVTNILEEDWLHQRKERLKTDPDTYQTLLKQLGEIELLSTDVKIMTYNIRTIEEYETILKTRGPMNTVLSKIPNNRREIVWHDILCELEANIKSNQQLPITVHAHGIVVQKRQAEERCP